MHQYDSLAAAIADLQQRGYTADFNLKADHLHLDQLELELHPEAFSVDEFYRFEGDSNPDDSSVVCAISANGGELRGIIVDAYGVYANNLTPAMAEKLKVNH